jgi:hypothetical protein
MLFNLYVVQFSTTKTWKDDIWQFTNIGKRQYPSQVRMELFHWGMEGGGREKNACVTHPSLSLFDQGFLHSGSSRFKFSSLLS